jgi:hypothetical protein
MCVEFTMKGRELRPIMCKNSFVFGFYFCCWELIISAVLKPIHSCDWLSDYSQLHARRWANLLIQERREGETKHWCVVCLFLYGSRKYRSNFFILFCLLLISTISFNFFRRRKWLIRNLTYTNARREQCCRWSARHFSIIYSNFASRKHVHKKSNFAAQAPQNPCLLIVNNSIKIDVKLLNESMIERDYNRIAINNKQAALIELQNAETCSLRNEIFIRNWISLNLRIKSRKNMCRYRCLLVK